MHVWKSVTETIEQIIMIHTSSQLPHHPVFDAVRLKAFRIFPRNNYCIIKRVLSTGFPIAFLYSILRCDLFDQINSNVLYIAKPLTSWKTYRMGNI